MRTFLLLTVLAAATVASAQTAPPPAPTPQKGSWDYVETIPAGTKLHLKFFSQSKADCRVAKIDDTTLSCDNSAVFKREAIESIRSNHRLRSTLVGVPVGYGIAAAVTITSFRSDSCRNSLGCTAAVGLVDLGILVATPIIGHFTDFTATTLYKADAPAAARP